MPLDDRFVGRSGKTGSGLKSCKATICPVLATPDIAAHARQRRLRPSPGHKQNGLLISHCKLLSFRMTGSSLTGVSFPANRSAISSISAANSFVPRATASSPGGFMRPTIS